MAHGAVKVYACCTHPVLSGPAIDRITNSPIEKMYVTDTIEASEQAKSCSKTETVTVSEVIGKAIDAIHNGLSISRLFD